MPDPTPVTPKDGWSSEENYYSELPSYILSVEEHQRRAFVAVAFWLLFLVVIPLSMSLIGRPWGFHVGLATYIAIVGETLPLFVVGVPEVCGLILINPFVAATVEDKYRNQRVCPTGLWFKFPWEQAKLGLFINLRMVNQKFDEDFPAKDGPLVHADGGVIYRPFLQLLPRYVAVDLSIINEGVVNIVTGWLSQQIGDMIATKARRSISYFQKGLKELFENPETLIDVAITKAIETAEERGLDPKEEVLKTLEWLFAIDVDLVRLGDIGYEEKYQRSLTSKAIATRIRETANKYREELPNGKDRTNLALIINQLVRKDVFETEGEAGAALASIFLNWGRGGGSSQPSSRS